MQPHIPDHMEQANAHLYSIVNALGGIRASISNLSENKTIKNSSPDINFETTIPNEYKSLFWEYHAKKGRGGTQMSNLFNGRINQKTAANLLKDARSRLEGKKLKR